MPVQKHNAVLTYEGCNYLRYRLLLSTLCGKSVRISEIRTKHDDPGLKEYEINFIRLLDKITNGTRIELNETGTTLHYTPGLLYGGDIEHECSLQRGIGYYLEAVLVLAPFCKKPLEIKLKGVTNNTIDPSVDKIKSAAIPILKRFLAGDSEIEFTVNKRGVPPLGGGEIFCKFPVNRNLKAIQLQDSGMVKRIRGIASSVRVSPALANRMVESAKGVLLKFIPDIYIHTNQCKGVSSGKSPGFGITLIAETTNGIFLSGETFSEVIAGSLPCVPENLGTNAATVLLDEIYRNGCVDSSFQSMAAVFMTLSKKDVSKLTTGPLTQTMIQTLRDLRDFFGVTFKIENVRDEDEILEQVSLTCIGIGYTNLSRRVL